MNMMNKKTILSVAMCAAMFAGNAMAADPVVPVADQGHGTIKFVGAIIDAPCSIAPESVDQTIQMGQIANSALESQKEGPLRPFEIHLEACALDTAKSATVTFNGIADDTDKKHLAINGSAKGAAIAMVNQQDGAEVVLGQPTKAVTLVAADNSLKFGAKLVSNLQNGTKAVPGQFTATADFIMSYQ